ncbi:substrate-binding domain-containing protein [Cronbergia sp. UHCC 0137]|uniref:substrate-binding domain-containing protein n=1 Tax=Cronbergia sp. UHCC 0137 TaxID=3110239 RepID=UPI002B21D3F6|nr:substrate-binding domain-containing protein [Cronbergia sp. UHCC 0137]MEA5617684.1 substrate-binding domain-containing protein [Cronbergia sp. UHCC 0137]
MWQQEKKDSAILSLGLWLALATTPMAVSFLISAPLMVHAANNPTFPLPETVEKGTVVQIDGSINLLAINQSLKTEFEQQFPGTKVEVGYNDTDVALKYLLDGKIDVATIARGLTPEEKEQGLEQILLHREKIAIIVGANNPFKGTLTSTQFAKIFRGEITDWSELGGTAGKIRFIDHPPTSETRNNFRPYPVFKTAEFATGSNAIQIADNDIGKIIQQLGKDGISYAIANQVSQLVNVRVIKIDQTHPNDSTYPFTQPLVYVYKKNPSPKVTSFLGYTLASPGKKAIESGRKDEAAAISTMTLQSFTQVNSNTITNENTSVATTSSQETESTPMSQSNYPTNEKTNKTPSQDSSGNEPELMNAINNNPLLEENVPIWMLFPAILISGFVGSIPWLFGGKRQLNQTNNSLQAPTSNVPNKEIKPTEINYQSPSNNSKSESTNNTTLADSKPEQISNLDIATDNITLDCGEVVWDTEAPVVVPNSHYSQIQNDAVNGERLTDNSSISLSELLDAPAALAQNNSSISLSKLLDSPVESTSNNSTISLSELLSSSVVLLEENTTNSSPDLPDIGLEVGENNLTNSSAESPDIGLEVPANDSVTSLLDLIDMLTEASNDDLTTSEVELTGDSTNSLSEFIDVLDDGSELEIPIDEITISDSKLPDKLKELWYSLTSKTQIKGDSTEEVSEELPAAGDILATNELLSGSNKTEINDGLLEEVFEELPTTGDILATNELLSGNHEPEIKGDSTEEVFEELPTTGDILATNELLSGSNELEINEGLVEEVSEELPAGGDILATNESDALIELLSGSNETEINEGLVEELFQELPAASDILATNENDALIASIDEISSNPQLELLEESKTTEIISLLDVSGDSSIVFTPRTPKWAYVSWYVPETEKEVLQKQASILLAVRLYDVTDMDLSYEIPQLIQQYECEEAVDDRYVAIPLGDRDYMTEIGYVINGDRWLCLARSGTIRIFSRPSADFWLVTDTELIIHGATQPGAKVTIDGRNLTLKSDGTFEWRVPFVNNTANYLMTATASNGEDIRTVNKKFSQDSSQN